MSTYVVKIVSRIPHRRDGCVIRYLKIYYYIEIACFTINTKYTESVLELT